jgi:EAL domain-containing protein (putative c-di-GMP-specific phosphodiesterase class I)
METEFDPLATAHIDLNIDLELEELPEIHLSADKFELWFQPVYALATGKVLHNEVLVRWRDLEGNLRQPHELLAVLQNTQLLQQLDLIVVEKSIEVLAQRPKVKVSVNLSNEIFMDQTFFSRLQGWLTHYKVSPKRLGFEFEEEVVGQLAPEAIAFMTRLQLMGCDLVIDNFTGKYFPLQQLQTLSITTIKLDRNLIQKSLSPSQKQLAMAIAQTSRIFKKQCIVKGIEDKYSLKFASDLGVEGVQGYALSTPQEKPRTFCLLGLLLTRIIALAILLYIFKSLVGIDIFPNRHAWDVITDFVQSIFDGK